MSANTNADVAAMVGPCRYCGGERRVQIVSPVSDHAWADCFCSRTPTGGSELIAKLREDYETQDTPGQLWRKSREALRLERREAATLLQSQQAEITRLSAMVEEGRWQSIDTHGGHCSPVLVCRETDTETNLATSAFMDVTGQWRLVGSPGGMAKLRFVPTHWQPLPRNPRARQALTTEQG